MSTVGGGVNIVTNGLVLYLDASNTKSYVSGSTTWNDVSRSRNNGSLINGPTFNSGNGGNIVFDGVDDYVNVVSSTSLNEPKTIESWVYVTSQQTAMILSRGIGNYELYTFTDGFVYTYWGNAFNSSINNPSVTLNIWNQFCFTLSGTTETVYKNGSLIGSRSLNTTPSYSNTGDLDIARRNTNTLYLNGRVSNCKIYNRTLSAAEVLQNYNATKSRFGL
jgi:hypothetical protein